MAQPFWYCTLIPYLPVFKTPYALIMLVIAYTTKEKDIKCYGAFTW